MIPPDPGELNTQVCESIKVNDQAKWNSIIGNRSKTSLPMSPSACAGFTATKGRLALLGAPSTFTANTNASAKASLPGELVAIVLCLIVFWRGMGIII